MAEGEGVSGMRPFNTTSCQGGYFHFPIFRFISVEGSVFSSLFLCVPSIEQYLDFQVQSGGVYLFFS